MVGYQCPVAGVYVTLPPPPVFTDLLWGRGREERVQSQKAITPQRKACQLVPWTINTKYIYTNLIVDLLSSHYWAQSKKPLNISSSHILQIELCEGDMFLPVASWKIYSKETHNWNALEAARGPDNMGFNLMWGDLLTRELITYDQSAWSMRR